MKYDSTKATTLAAASSEIDGGLVRIYNYQRLSRAAPDPAVVSRRVGDRITFAFQNDPGTAKVRLEQTYREGRDPMNGIRALVFDTFGTLVDWRSGMIAHLSSWGVARGIRADLADACRCVADGLSALP